MSGVDPSINIQRPNLAGAFAKWIGSNLGKSVALSLLGVLVLASRVPFVSKILYHWDSVNFAYAMQEFNLAKEQPQPPGYIVYVWLARFFDIVFHDPQTSMVVISVLACVGAVIGMFWLGERLFNARVGWIGAAFLAASPLFWFYNEIALPHTVDAFLVIIGALFLYRVMQGERRFIIPAVVVMAIAGGVRQQTLVFLAPLLLIAFRKTGWKTILGAGLLGVALCLAWFLPLIALNGGLTQYLAVMNDFSARFQDTTSLLLGAGVFGLTRNFTKLFMYTAYGWSVFALPFLLLALISIPKIKQFRISERSAFIGLWIAPAFFYYLLVHMGQQGLVFVFLPALILIGAAAVDAIWHSRPGVEWGVALILVFCSASIFLFLPEFPLGEGTQRLLTRQTIENSDRYFIGRFNQIRAEYPPNQTIIVAQNWHHVQFYLPEYKTYEFNLGSKWEIDEGVPVYNTADIRVSPLQDLGMKPGITTIIIFDPPISRYVQADLKVESIPLSFQNELGILRVSANDIFYVSANQIGIKTR